MNQSQNHTDTLLEVENVSKKFVAQLKRSMQLGMSDFLGSVMGKKIDSTRLRKDEFWAVKNVSFQVKRGDRLGVLGLNGAGKTTLMKMLCGIYCSDEGTITSFGKIMPLFAVTAGMNPLFTGRENIYLKAAVFGMSKAEVNQKLDAIIDFAELAAHIDSPFGTYSSGMKARLAFAIAIHAQFDILIIDEGLAVGDLSFRTKAYKRLDEISQSIATISVAHNPNILARVSNRIMVMNQGEIIHESHQVGEAIDFYYDKFLTQKTTSEITDNIKPAQGEILRKVELLCDRKEEVALLKQGQPLTIQFTINTNKLPNKAQLVVHFHTAEREPLAIAESKLTSFFLEAQQGEIVCKAQFASIQFKPGIYTLHVAVNRGEHFEIYEKLNHVDQLQIIGDFRSHAPLQLLPEWILE